MAPVARSAAMKSLICVLMACRSAFGGGECANALQFLEFFPGPATEVLDVIRIAPFGGEFDQPLIARTGGGLIAQCGGGETNACRDVLIGTSGEDIRLGELLHRLRGFAEIVECPPVAPEILR